MMGDMFLTGMSDVNSPIPVFPEWSFQDDRTIRLSSQRTQGGALYTYRWGGFRSFKMPLRFVNSSDRSQVIQWWENQETVAFTLDSSETASTFQCRIVNGSNPLGQHPMPYRELFQGQLNLESLDDSDPAGRPFILDDSIFGLLDQNYNTI